MSGTRPHIVYPTTGKIRLAMWETQPDIVYPTTGTVQPSSHSKGSFGLVFIVLAIIIGVSATACIVSRLCARKCSLPKVREDHNSNPKESNIEDGLKERISDTKPAPNGVNKEPKLVEHDESNSEINPDESKSEIKSYEGEEAKGSA